MNKEKLSAAKQTRSSIRSIYLGILLLLVAAVLVVVIILLPERPTLTKPPASTQGFTHQGKASFYSDGGALLCSFDLEIADTEEKRKRGLMERDTLSTGQAMLFIMDANEIQRFWMKNTYLPLDIIFIGEDSLIVSISEHTRPFSEDNIASAGKSKFVLEVNAGLSQRFGLKPGDRFRWNRIAENTQTR